MNTQDVKRKLTAILSADVEGYSRLMSDDEVGTIRTLSVYRDAMTNLILLHRGRVVDAPGDNLLAEFVSVVDAVQCAVEIQRDLAERNQEMPENKRMHFRIGVNLGDVVEEKDRIYGDGVNIAARLESLCKAGGVCISGAAFDNVENKLDLEFEDLGEHQVKNINKPVRVYRVLSFPGAAAQRVIKAKIAVGRRWRNITLAAAAVVVAIVSGLIWQLYFSPTGTQEEPASRARVASTDRTINSLAVLPFNNAGKDPDIEYLSDGITESLIYNLSYLPNLKVRSMNSVYHYKGKQIDAKTIGSNLNVQVVLTGRIVQRGQDVSISVELVDVIDNSFLWGENYQRKFTDILVIQKDIGLNVSKNLRLQLSPDDRARIAKRTTENNEAYQLYLKGRYHASQFTREGVQKGLDLLTQAIELDPNYALAYEGLAYFGLASMDWIIPANDVMPKAKKAALKALEIDESLAEAHSMLGGIYVHYEWNWEAAEKEFKRALELDPDHLDAHSYYGWYLSAMGQHDRAIAESQRAVEIDPLSSEAGWILGEALYFAGRYDEAIEANQKTLELNPYYWPAKVSLARAYLQKGQYKEAIAVLKKVIESGINNPYPTGWLGYAFGLAGHKKDAEKILKELTLESQDRFISPIYFALIHIGLNNIDQVFEWMNKSYQAHSWHISFLKVMPEFDPLRNDPRFTVLLKNANF